MKRHPPDFSQLMQVLPYSLKSGRVHTAHGFQKSPPVFQGRLLHFFKFSLVRGNRLLAQHMFAPFQHLDALGSMKTIGTGHIYSIYLLTGSHVFQTVKGKICSMFSGKINGFFPRAGIYAPEAKPFCIFPGLQKPFCNNVCADHTKINLHLNIPRWS